MIQLKYFEILLFDRVLWCDPRVNKLLPIVVLTQHLFTSWRFNVLDLLGRIYITFRLFLLLSNSHFPANKPAIVASDSSTYQ